MNRLHVYVLVSGLLHSILQPPANSHINSLCVMSKDSSIVTMLFKIHSLFTKLIHPWSGLLHFYEFHHTMIAHLSLTFLCLGQVKGRASFIGSVLNVFLIKIETKVEENCKANSLSPYFSFLRFIF